MSRNTLKEIALLSVILIIFMGCKTQKLNTAYKSENLKVEMLTESTYRHISYLSTDNFGKVSCNGMIVIDGGEAVVLDTPTNNEDSKELIDWIEISLKCRVVGVVATHFHDDCLGGLSEFHIRKIPSYASFRTIELAKAGSLEIPQIGFDRSLEIKVGKEIIVNAFFGEGHTKDNIVCYFPSENVLFGGCLIKTMGASKGYMGDANIDEWSNSVSAIKMKYNNAKVIVPGHGKPGNTELLDYTIALFKTE